MEVRNSLQPIVARNKAQQETNDAYEGWCDPSDLAQDRSQQYLSKIRDIREYDVAYHIRTMIDNEIRCSCWYDVTFSGPLLTEMKKMDKLDAADLRIFAFDIETTKAELKFPDAKFD